MKKLLFIALALQLGLSACKKDDVDPVASADAATVVDGTYTINQTTSNGTVTKLPANGVAGQITFSRMANNQSTMQLLITSSGTTLSDNKAPVYLVGSGGTVDIYAESAHTTKLGVATKNSVKLSAISNGVTATIDASR